MTDKTIKGKNIRNVLLGIVLLAVLGTFRYTAADNSLVSRNTFTLYQGDVLDLGAYVLPEYGEHTTYLLDGVTSQNIVSVDSSGKIKAENTGIASVAVIANTTDGVLRATVTVTVRGAQNMGAVYGDTLTFDAAGNDLYAGSSFVSDNRSASVSQSTIAVQGFEKAGIYACKPDGSKVLVAYITVIRPTLEDGQGTARALGTAGYHPALTNCSGNYTYSLYSQDNQIVKVQDNLLVPVSEGNTMAEFTIYSVSGQSVCLTFPIAITDPILTENEIVIAVGMERELMIEGISEYSRIKWNEKSKLVSLKEGAVTGLNKGNKKMLLNVDGRELIIQVTVTNPRYTGDGLVLHKGLKLQVGIKGLNSSKSEVTYRSQNPKIASVNKKGKVTARKKGSTYIIVCADGKEIAVYVGVTTKKARLAVNREKAIAKSKTKYSQSRRMSKGYYDCSSLVWRCYSRYRVNFGVRSGWAPTAANIAQWCQNKNKKISNKAVLNTNKLLPGDLIFYSSSWNGRFKNITHVETYIGNNLVISASSRNNAVVKLNYYGTDSIVMIARPTR